MEKKIFTAKDFGSHNENAICPCCKVNRLGKYPAISRGGSQYLLCPECGRNEALIIFGLNTGSLSLDDVKTVTVGA